MIVCVCVCVCVCRKEGREREIRNAYSAITLSPAHSDIYTQLLHKVQHVPVHSGFLEYLYDIYFFSCTDSSELCGSTNVWRECDRVR